MCGILFSNNQFVPSDIFKDALDLMYHRGPDNQSCFANDNVSFKVQLMNKVKSVYKFSGSAFNKDLKVCEAEFTAMITDNNKEIL